MKSTVNFHIDLNIFCQMFAMKVPINRVKFGKIMFYVQGKTQTKAPCNRRKIIILVRSMYVYNIVCFNV